MRPAAAALLLGALACACARACAGARSGSPPSPPTWSGEVAALVQRHCLDCHVAEGSAPFALDTYDQARRRARRMAESAASGKMPPWMVVGTPGVFLGERGLSPREVALLAAWAEAGAPLGDPDEAPAPVPPRAAGWRLGSPDVVLKLRAPVEVAAEGGDIWRSLSLPTGFTEDRWVRAFEVRIENQRAVHHLLLRMDEGGVVRAMEEQSGEFGLPMMPISTDVFFGEVMGAWLPGADPPELPPDTAARVPAGSDLVLDMHFRTTGKPESVGAEVGLYFAARPPERMLTTFFFNAGGINILPGDPEYTLRAEFRVPVDARIIAVAPHEHYVGRSARVHLRPPAGEPRTLIRIDDWDFAWQGIWRLRDPLPIEAGSVVELDFAYDNSEANPRNPHAPPRRIFTGPRANQEMADVWMLVSLASEEERMRLRDAVAAAYAPTVDPRGETAMWLGLLEGFDADRDGSLDAAEDAAAGAWLMALEDDGPELREWFDRDGDCVLGADERAEVARLRGVWRGER